MTQPFCGVYSRADSGNLAEYGAKQWDLSRNFLNPRYITYQILCRCGVLSWHHGDRMAEMAAPAASKAVPACLDVSGA